MIVFWGRLKYAVPDDAHYAPTKTLLCSHNCFSTEMLNRQFAQVKCDFKWAVKHSR